MGRMRWLRVVATVGVAALAGCGSQAQVERPDEGDGLGGGPLAVVSSLDGSKPTALARLDPRTLAPRPERVELGEYHDAWSFSPDGSQVAFGISAPPPASGSPERLGVRIVDPAKMSVSRDVSTGIAAEALGWLSSSRLVALLQSGEVVLIDPRTGEVLRRESVRPFELQCGPQPSAVTPHGLVLLLAGGGRTPARLVVVNAQGRVRAVSLPGVRISGECGRGGLATDSARNRAFAAGNSARVAEIDLRTMELNYHRVTGARFRGFVRGSLVWLGDGLLAASGRNRDGTPAGVTVIDTRTWRGELITSRAGAATPAPGAVLVYDGTHGEPQEAGIGLRAYTRDGRRLFHALDQELVDDVQVAEGRAYASSSAARHLVNVRSGQVIDGGTRTEDFLDILDERSQPGG